jgi:hypothetical protein
MKSCVVRVFGPAVAKTSVPFRLLHSEQEGLRRKHNLQVDRKKEKEKKGKPLLRHARSTTLNTLPEQLGVVRDVLGLPGLCDGRVAADAKLHHEA